MPSTNARIFVSVILAALYVIVLLTAIVIGRTLQTEVVTALGFFLTIWLGIDVAQFKIKRDSFNAALPLAAETDGAAPTIAPRAER